MIERMNMDRNGQMRWTWAGLVAFAWFFIALLAFAAVRPEYQHATKAISELGVFGAPNMLAWNLLGFILPGVLLVLFARGYRARMGKGAIGYFGLVLTGVCFALTGIPGELGGDGDPDRQSIWTQAHLMASMFVAVPWAWSLVSIMLRHRTGALRGLAVISMIALIGLVVPVAYRSANPGFDAPGLLQRVTFLGFFGWYAAAAWLLRRTDGSSTR